MPEPVRPAYHLYRWLWGSLDLLYPPDCGGCGRRGSLWCETCHGKVQQLNNNICALCGQPWDSPGLCFRCREEKPHFSCLRSWAVYDGPLREAIRALKYQRNISLGIVLSDPLHEMFDRLAWQIDAVIPVPLGVARLQERGYNQAILIARPLALRIGKPLMSNSLIRVRETRTQVGLSHIQRRDNVANAFWADAQSVGNLNVLLVDDVATSSATLNACAQALLRAGSQDVYCLTLARAS